MNITKHAALAIAAATAATAFAGSPAPAQASCTQIDGVDGCVENYVCDAGWDATETARPYAEAAGVDLPYFYCSMRAAQGSPESPPSPIVTDPCAPDHPCTPNPRYDPQWPKKMVAWAKGLAP